MAFTISSKNNEKTFADKEVISISSKSNADFVMNVGFDFLLTLQYDAGTNKCVLLNQFNNQNFLFKGKPIPQRLEIEKICKIMVLGSDEYITIKILGETINKNIAEDNITEADVRSIYGNNINAGAKIMIEKRKSEIEAARVNIVKEFWAELNELTKKISMNSKSGIILHIALMFASLITAFGVSNYLTGLPLKDAGSIIQMPTNMKLIFIYAVIIYGIGLILKQGVFLYLQNKNDYASVSSSIAEKFMIGISSIFYSSIYIINVLYYLTPNTMPVFAVLISAFFTVSAATLAIACGYFKHNSVEMRSELNKIEYRPDFENVMKEYRQWVERFANTISSKRVRDIKDETFVHQIKGFGEIILGIMIAPFLAYGVSITLAMCFPEAAGWVRISGLRFSPVFLVLASFMIVFAFFSFVNGFLANKKIQGSKVIKQDGFSNFKDHGTEIFGLEGVKKLEAESRRSFTIGISIVLIEFLMNLTYFVQGLGVDLQGLFVSVAAALVPTAILIADTYILSQNRYEIYNCNTLLEKIDHE